MKIERVALDAIQVLPGRRVADPATVERIAESIGARGLLQPAGVTTGIATDRRQIKSDFTLQKIDERAPGLLEATLRFVHSAWLDEPYSNQAMTLLGVARFLYTCQGAAGWTEKEAITRLRKSGIQEVKTYSRGNKIKPDVRGQAARFCEAMILAYNDHRGIGGRTLKAVRSWDVEGE
jgi:hypothetical protein